MDTFYKKESLYFEGNNFDAGLFKLFKNTQIYINIIYICINKSCYILCRSAIYNSEYIGLLCLANKLTY